MEDVNIDGLPELVFHFRFGATGFSWGTFTDLVLVDEATGAVRVGKLLTTAQAGHRRG